MHRCLLQHPLLSMSSSGFGWQHQPDGLRAKSSSHPSAYFMPGPTAVLRSPNWPGAQPSQLHCLLQHPKSLFNIWFWPGIEGKGFSEALNLVSALVTASCGVQVGWQPSAANRTAFLQTFKSTYVAPYYEVQ